MGSNHSAAYQNRYEGEMGTSGWWRNNETTRGLYTTCDTWLV